MSMNLTIKYEVSLRTIVQREEKYGVVLRKVFELPVSIPLSPVEGLIVWVGLADFTIKEVHCDASNEKIIAYINEFKYSSMEKIEEVIGQLKSLGFKEVFDDLT